MAPGNALRRRRDGGFTYVAMLFALAIFGVGLAALGESWSAASRRAREHELIEIGSAYARAIGTYYERSPGAQKQYPERLDELVEDHRFVGVVRHMRRLERDPVTNGDWGIIRTPDGRIQGVYSVSDKPVLRTRPTLLTNATIISGVKYSDWKFVYEPNHDKKP